MHTFLFSGVTAAGLMMTGAPAVASTAVSAMQSSQTPRAMEIFAHGQRAPMQGYVWNGQNDRTSVYQEADSSPAILPEGNAYNWNDDSNVAFAAPDGSSYSYDGNWQGKYVDPQGRVFEGEWTGRVTRQDGVSGPGYPAPRQPATAPQQPPADAPDAGTNNHITYSYDASDRGNVYAVPRGYENYERCLKSNGVKGAAIGALIGGLAGNRIAGNGNRTGGSLLGAAIGGLLGVSVEKASKNCHQHLPSANPSPVYSYTQPQQPYYYYPQPQQVYYYAQPQQSADAARQGGYYYYPQAMPVTTVVTGAPYTTTTTTVTEEVYYENIPSAPRKKAARK
jgi:hypothetical protein